MTGETSGREGEPSTTNRALQPTSPWRDDAQKRWLETRAYLNKHRYRLTQTAQDLYPSSWRVADTPLLARPEWLPTTPIPLDEVLLSWRPGALEAGVTGTEAESEAVRPLRTDGTRFVSYADALGALSRPKLFEDRACYRIIDANTTSAGANLEFCDGRYFDILNVCEAVAHEYRGSRRRHESSVTSRLTPAIAGRRPDRPPPTPRDSSCQYPDPSLGPGLRRRTDGPALARPGESCQRRRPVPGRSRRGVPAVR